MLPIPLFTIHTFGQGTAFAKPLRAHPHPRSSFQARAKPMDISAFSIQGALSPRPHIFRRCPPSPRKHTCRPQPHNRCPNRSCSTMASVASAARVSSECRDGSARKSLFSRSRTHHNTGSTSPRTTSHSRSTSSRPMATYGGAPRPFSSPPQSMAGAIGHPRSGGAIVSYPVSRAWPRPATPSSLETGPPPAHSRNPHPHPQAPTTVRFRGCPKRRAPSGNGCQSVRSLPKSKSGSGSQSCMAPCPLSRRKNPAV